MGGGATDGQAVRPLGQRGQQSLSCWYVAVAIVNARGANARRAQARRAGVVRTPVVLLARCAGRGGVRGVVPPDARYAA
jgi:hypothetical protein